MIECIAISKTGDTNDFTEKLVKLKEEFSKNCYEVLRLTAQIILNQISPNLLSLNKTAAPEAPILSDTHIISKAKEYIDDHYMKDISLVEVAKSVFLSQSHFSRYFKKETGENFIDYLNKVRILKAQELLLNSAYNVNEISNMVGYGSTNYFYKKFKLQTGYTAQEYRAKFSK